MKRYHKRCAMDDSADGYYVIYEEAAATIAEKDKELARLKARWEYIKTDIEGARALLILLRDGKGTPDDFDTMVDRIIESRKGAGL